MTVTVTPAAAQQVGDEVPRSAEAEQVFTQAVEAFEEGDYGMAYRRFRLVWQDYPLNRKTTAALLMGGKAAYRQGEYERAVRVLSRLEDDYTTSSYVDEARRTRELAVQAQEAAARQPRILDLGVLLPTGTDTTSLTQELFDGIHLAVDAFNEADRATKVRMIYRGAGTPGTVGDSVRALAELGADLIVGPLFSDTAVPAARAAERERTVLVTPLATDEEVSNGHAYVFQANPTITMRGRRMAAFAARSLRLDTVGVVAEGTNSLGRRMAHGFEEEAARQGMTLLFSERLEGSSGWYNLQRVLSPDTLRLADAVYLPISGRRASRYIDAALGSLSRMNVQPRVLGNAEWHDLPFRDDASDFRATYTNDFYVDERRGEVAAFRRNYGDLAQTEPGRLAYTGFDLTTFLLQTLYDVDQPDFREALREAPPFEGLGRRYEFDGGNVNRALFFHRYRFGRVDLLR